MIRITDKIKRRYKAYLFRKFCRLSGGLSVSASANVFVEKGGRIDIGKDCEICALLSCKKGGILTIGSHTTIRGGEIQCLRKVQIGDHVIISNNVTISDNNNHPTSPLKRVKMCESGFHSTLWGWPESESAPVVICGNVWIGARCTILKGVTIGEGAIVACDSVVTKDVPPFTIAAGNPARIVKQITNDKI